MPWISTTQMEFSVDGRKVGTMHVRLMPHDTKGEEWMAEVKCVAAKLAQFYRADVKITNYGERVFTILYDAR